MSDKKREKIKHLSGKFIGGATAISPLLGGVLSMAGPKGVLGPLDETTGTKLKRGASVVGAGVAGALAGKFGSLKLAQILSKTRPDLLKKLTTGTHKIAKARLSSGSNLASLAGSGAGGGYTHRAMTKDED